LFTEGVAINLLTLIDGSRLEDAAKYVSPARIAIALVAVTSVLPIALVVAPHEPFAKSLR
jgi:hypothetical protein